MGRGAQAETRSMVDQQLAAQNATNQQLYQQNQALTNQVAREQDIVGLRLGQRVMVDDGSCPQGQIKEVHGAKMTSSGVEMARKCVPRSGPKTSSPKTK